MLDAEMLDANRFVVVRLLVMMLEATMFDAEKLVETSRLLTYMLDAVMLDEFIKSGLKLGTINLLDTSRLLT